MKLDQTFQITPIIHYLNSGNLEIKFRSLELKMDLWIITCLCSKHQTLPKPCPDSLQCINHKYLYPTPTAKRFKFLKTRYKGLQLLFLDYRQIPYRLRDISFQSQSCAAKIYVMYTARFRSVTYLKPYNSLLRYALAS